MGRACNRSFETRITGVMMRKITTLGAACCGLLSVYPSIRLSAQALHVPYQTFTLPNGLQVLLHEDHSVPLVSVNVWYHVGSSDEKPGRTGFAHLFEHIMFMGSQHVPTGEFDRLLEAAGADNNGSTTEDRTNYYEDGPANALPLMLYLDADRMGFLLPEITANKVDLQRGVVQNERRQSYENRPYGLAEENILERLYPASHPYHWPVIGSMADLQAATLDDVRRFFQTYYTPNNATLAIAGDITPRDARQFVERYFGDIARGPAVTRTPPPRVQLTGAVGAVLEDRVQLPRVYDAWHTVKAFSVDDATLDVLANVLAGGRSSRLYRRLVYELQIATDVVAFQDGGRIDGKFEVYATARPGHDLGELQRVIDEELRKLADRGPTPREVERAQNTVEAQFLSRMERVGGGGALPAPRPPGPPVRQIRPTQAPRTAASPGAQAPRRADHDAPERPHARRRRDAQGAGSGRPAPRGRGCGAGSVGRSRARHLHGDDAAAGSGRAQRPRRRGRGRVPRRPAQHGGELRRGERVDPRAQTTTRRRARSAGRRRAAAQPRRFRGRAAAAAARRAAGAAARRAGRGGERRIPGNRVRSRAPVRAPPERHRQRDRPARPRARRGGLPELLSAEWRGHPGWGPRHTPRNAPPRDRAGPRLGAGGPAPVSQGSGSRGPRTLLVA